MEVGNAAMHAGMAARERRYNPGLGTAVGLMGAHAVASARALRRSARIKRRDAILASPSGAGSCRRLFRRAVFVDQFGDGVAAAEA